MGLLRHIGSTKVCKSYYSPRLANRHKRKNFRKKEKILKTYHNKRKRKCQQNEKSRKRKQKKIKSKEGRKNIALTQRGLNCKGIAKEEESEDDEVGKNEVQCRFVGKI